MVRAWVFLGLEFVYLRRIRHFALWVGMTTSQNPKVYFSLDLCPPSPCTYLFAVIQLVVNVVVNDSSRSLPGPRGSELWLEAFGFWG